MFGIRVVVSIIFLTALSFGQHYGSVSGTVTDEAGNPVVNAKVSAIFSGSRDGPIPQEETDAAGHYAFSRLSYGPYWLSASKEQDDYPPQYVGFYAGFGVQQQIDLSDANQIVSIDLKLGKKAGILTGTVTDADTGNPIDAHVEFRCTDDPRRFLYGSLSSQFRWLIPSDTPVLMKVSKEGYEDWWYRKNGAVDGIRLDPGTSLTMNVKVKKAVPNVPQTR